MSSKHLYIISDYKFKKHTYLERAKEELQRLSSLYPDRHFRIYKVCPSINRFGETVKQKTKQDIKTDYKNPPWQKGPTEATPKEITLDCFRGNILTKGGKNG